MLSELGQAFSAMEDDSDIRCGVLCAEGGNFTAGLELNRVAKHLEPDSKAYARARRLIPNWIAAKVTKAARVSARFS